MRRLATLADLTGGARERPVQREAILLLAMQGVEAVHVPNGSKLAGTGKQRAIQMRNMKLDGLRPGFPDLLLFDTRAQARMGTIEVKREKGGVVSEKQEGWAEKLTSWGIPYALITTPEEAVAAIRRWGWR